jgi:hypothetical protein
VVNALESNALVLLANKRQKGDPIIPPAFSLPHLKVRATLSRPVTRNSIPHNRARCPPDAPRRTALRRIGGLARGVGGVGCPPAFGQSVIVKMLIR